MRRAIAALLALVIASAVGLGVVYGVLLLYSSLLPYLLHNPFIWVQLLTTVMIPLNGLMMWRRRRAPHSGNRL